MFFQQIDIDNPTQVQLVDIGNFARIITGISRPMMIKIKLQLVSS